MNNDLRKKELEDRLNILKKKYDSLVEKINFYGGVCPNANTIFNNHSHELYISRRKEREIILKEIESINKELLGILPLKEKSSCLIL